jgi:signal transduction histidine kinase
MGSTRRSFAMMHVFIANNREELLARCKAKVARRPHRDATLAQLSNGTPLFLEQLERTLVAEEGGDSAQSLQISGGSGGDALSLSEMGVSATAHGKQLLELGFTVDQVVHDYGDLCQAITDLAVERDAPFGVHEFRTLNRCLDNAIADAVTEFSFQRDASLAHGQEHAVEQRIGFLAHELRNSLSSATLAFAALETGKLPITGATGAVLKRALFAMARLVTSAVADVRGNAKLDGAREVFSVKQLIADAASAADLNARASGCTLVVLPVDEALEVNADRERILGAIANLLQNAFKFTTAGTEVTLNASSYGSLVSIEVADHCGGLPKGTLQRMFTPFTQRSTDRSGLGLGLSIARQSVELDGGTLSARDVPGIGCVFTLSLPRTRASRRVDDAGPTPTA